MLIQNSTAPTPPPARQDRESAPANEAQTQQIVAPQAVVAPQATATSATQTAEKPVPAAQLQSAVENTNKAMLASNKNLAFSVDTDTKQTVVKLMDSSTGDVIGQFPTHQMLEISKAIGLMQEQLQQASLSKAPVQATQGLLIKQLA